MHRHAGCAHMPTGIEIVVGIKVRGRQVDGGVRTRSHSIGPQHRNPAQMLKFSKTLGQFTVTTTDTLHRLMPGRTDRARNAGRSIACRSTLDAQGRERPQVVYRLSRVRFCVPKQLLPQPEAEVQPKPRLDRPTTVPQLGTARIRRIVRRDNEPCRYPCQLQTQRSARPRPNVEGRHQAKPDARPRRNTKPRASIRGVNGSSRSRSPVAASGRYQARGPQQTAR